MKPHQQIKRNRMALDNFKRIILGLQELEEHFCPSLVVNQDTGVVSCAHQSPQDTSAHHGGWVLKSVAHYIPHCKDFSPQTKIVVIIKS